MAPHTKFELDYRMGLFIEKEIVIFSRLLHRKEIYKNFP